MNPLARLLLLLIGGVVGVDLWVDLAAVAVDRTSDDVAAAAAAALVFGPALLAALLARDPPTAGGLVMLAWAGMVRASLPTFVDAPSLALLPGPPPTAASAPLVAPPPRDLGPHQIALPYEGEGRSLTVPIVLSGPGGDLELDLLLDTGATYTSVPADVLARIGAHPSPDAPDVRLLTANGPRESKLAWVDRVWLGDLAVEGVAVATCDECRSEGASGLLGLNVSGGFNLNIDADAREVVFTAREHHDRKLDVQYFTSLDGRFRQAWGRVRMSMQWTNRAPRPIVDGAAEVSCGDQRWVLPLGSVPANATERFEGVLPAHTPCDGYQIGLSSASW